MSGHQLRVMIRYGRRPDPEGAAGWLGSPGAAVAGHPHPFNDVDVFGGPFGAGPQPRHMRAAITVGPRPRRRYARPTARPRSAAASRQHRLVADHDDAGIKRLGLDESEGQVGGEMVEQLRSGREDGRVHGDHILIN